MMGVGRTHGAVSVLNAIATGIGGAVGVDLEVEARVRLDGGCGVEIRSHTPWGPVEPPRRLLEAVAWLAGRLGHEGGVRIEVHSGIPPASGLKSSSAVVNAIVSGLLDALGLGRDPVEVASLGVEVARRAGLTITGAFDDSLATVAEGVFITDNGAMRVLRRIRFDDELYSVIAVPGRRSIESVDPEEFRRLSNEYRVAVELALSGNWAAAMTLNGILTLAATGWDPRSLDLVARALSAPGVIAAGVSGKGPAVFAVTRDPGAVAEAWGGGDLIIAKLLGGGG